MSYYKVRRNKISKKRNKFRNYHTISKTKSPKKMLLVDYYGAGLKIKPSVYSNIAHSKSSSIKKYRGSNKFNKSKTYCNIYANHSWESPEKVSAIRKRKFLFYKKPYYNKIKLNTKDFPNYKSMDDKWTDTMSERAFNLFD